MDDWLPGNATTLKLTFLRDIVKAAPDPQAELFPLLELATAIISSPVSPAQLVERFGSLPE